MSDVMNVTVREETGTRAVRRLRKAGQTPAILYGHGEANVNLAVPTADVETVLRHGGKMIDLQGALSEKALIRDVQWDAFGMHVLHLDLTRVSAGELVVVAVTVETRGEAPGTKAGGILDHAAFQLDIECPAASIPDKLVANVKSLEVGDSIQAHELELPEGARLVSPADTLIVTCQAAAPDVDEEPTEAPTAAEPEVIGRKTEDEDDEN